MSYILEALKRSEQERNQEKMPGFTANDMILPATNVRTHWWPYALIAVLLLNALLYVFFNWNTSSQQDSERLDVGIETSSGAAALQPVQTTSPHAASNAVNRPSLPILPERKHLAERTQQRVADKFVPPVMQDKRSNEIVSKPELSARTLPVDRPVPDTPDTDKSVNEAVKYGAQVEGGVLITPSSQAAIKPIDKPVSDALVVESNIEKIVPPPSDEALKEPISQFENTPLLSELDINFQRSVPELIFNSHIYSDQSSARRVMINSLYLKEGQMFDGLELIEIGESHIVVNKDGALFKLPVLRDWYKP